MSDAPADANATADFDPATGPSAVTTAQALRDGATTSRALATFALERLRAGHAVCNSVIAFEDDSALALADQADAERAAGTAAGPLHGVALAHKDMFDRTGRTASWGGNIQAEAPASTPATVIARLEAAGSFQVAALHLTEFAFGASGHNFVRGHARNPFNPNHIAGGSSSGSAISVATGAVPFALGSDTAGSLRLPAAACGVKSLKPTWTRVSRAGCMPLSGALDCVGPIARHVEDIALGFGLIAGHDPRDGLSARRPVPDVQAALTASTRPLKIAIADTLNADADAHILAKLDDVRTILSDTGCTVHATACSNWGEIGKLMQLLQFPEVASAHGRTMRHRNADYGPQVRARIEYGHFISAADHQTALRARGMILKQFLNEALADCDALLMPVFMGDIPTVAELDLTSGPELMAGLGRVLHFTRPLNYLGLPAMTLPYARRGDDLPNGFQLVGRPFGETALITLAAAYERAVPPEVAKLS